MLKGDFAARIKTVKQTDLIAEINSVLSLLPDEQQTTVILRYEGAAALLKTIAAARQKLEELKVALQKTQ